MNNKFWKHFDKMFDNMDDMFSSIDWGKVGGSYSSSEVTVNGKKIVITDKGGKLKITVNGKEWSQK